MKELAKFFMANFENVGGLLQLRPGQSGSEKWLTEILAHFFIIIKCLPQHQLLQPLTNLACDPNLMAVSFDRDLPLFLVAFYP